MSEKLPLSVAIITENEEDNLPSCLKSVEFADQIVVVDSGSTDQTVKIAKDFGCNVYIEPWRGFGPQKQSAINKCTHSWVLVIDADERFPIQKSFIIKKIICDPNNKTAGYSFPRKNYFQGSWIKHMGWWPDRIVRLFRKELGIMSSDSVHESIIINGPIEPLDIPLEHYTESHFDKILNKINLYSSLGAEKAYAQGKRSTIPLAFFRAQLAFLHNYFLRLGFLDGRAGLTLAITDSVNKFFKYAKLWQLNQQRRIF